MKKNIISVMAMAAGLFAVSCQKEAPVSVPSNEVSEFTAYVDGADQLGTKTVLDGLQSKWSGQERIWILNGDSKDNGWKKAYAATLSAPSATATFKEEDAATTLTGTNFMAVYPALPAGSATWDGAGDVKTMWLNPVQNDVIQASYDPQAHIAIAQTTNNTLSFKNVVSFFKFTVVSDDVTEVCIFGNAQEKIAGNFNINWNNGDPTVNGATEAYAKIVAPKDKTLTKGQTYYIAVLPTTFTQGFTVEVVSKVGKGKPKSSAKAYTLTRNKIVNLGEVVYTPEKVTTRPFYLKVGCWDVLDATEKYDAWVWGGSAGAGIWVDFTQIGTTEYYETQIPADATNIEVCRRSSTSAGHDWNIWNSLKFNGITAAHNCFIVKDWSTAELGTYTLAQ